MKITHPLGRFVLDLFGEDGDGAANAASVAVALGSRVTNRTERTYRENPAYTPVAADILDSLVRDGFLKKDDHGWYIARGPSEGWAEWLADELQDSGEPAGISAGTEPGEVIIDWEQFNEDLRKGLSPEALRLVNIYNNQGTGGAPDTERWWMMPDNCEESSEAMMVAYRRIIHVCGKYGVLPLFAPKRLWGG